MIITCIIIKNYTIVEVLKYGLIFFPLTKLLGMAGKTILGGLASPSNPLATCPIRDDGQTYTETRSRCRARDFWSFVNVRVAGGKLQEKNTYEK